MINLIQFINENARTTNSNKERRAELEKWLANKNYPDYVNTLNKMLDDPKAKTLLQDGFGGKLGNMKFTYSVKEIAAEALRPTQSEIDINKSIKHGLTKLECVEKDFNEPIIINNMPLITFRGNYVIDGHHRWAEAAVINPSGKMLCFDYDADISIIAMLKAVQGAIAAVIADKNDKNSKLPTSKVDDVNIFDMSEEEITKYVEDTITNPVSDYLKFQSKTQITKFIVDNILSLQANNYPESGMPNRGEMPQTDKAGTNKADKTTAFPDNDGSALNKLKTGKIDKDAIK